MTGLLTGDWHLTDNPVEEYRWDTFDLVEKIAIQYRVTHIYLLGDIFDRKDRHSKELVNEATSSLEKLQVNTDSDVIVVMGNHDKPVSGVPYWSFLNRPFLSGGSSRIRYVSEPEMFGNVLVLPFSSNPVEEWKGLPFSSVKMILMHQTVEGSLSAEGRPIPSSDTLPVFPKGIPIYSGDIHRPQRVMGVEYIGVPHPVRFNETWPNRVLVVNDRDFSKFIEVPLMTTHRAILDIDSSTDLRAIRTNPGDQVRIRYKLNSEKMTQWPVEEEACKQWAMDRNIFLASLEGVFTEDIGISKDKTTAESSGIELMSPEDVLTLFGKEENLAQEIIDVGMDILKTVRK
jgi:DNA repair exonuclease SbcCD nuclease subunit